MKHRIISLSIFVGILCSGALFGQSSETEKTVFIVAIEAVDDNTNLSDQDKKKFIARLEFIAKSKIEIQEMEYKRIAENYKKQTGLSLPIFSPLKE